MTYLITGKRNARIYVPVKVLSSTPTFTTVELLAPAFVKHLGQKAKGDVVRVLNSRIKERP